MKTLLTTCFLVILIFSCVQSARSQAAGPTLFTQENSQRAIAVESVLFARDPLPVVARVNFSNDRRTRVTLFGTNMDLLPGETASAMTASARDSRSKTYDLNVESVRKVPGFDFLTQVVVKLPDALAQAGDVWVSVRLHEQTSNEVLVNIHVQTEPQRATLVARRIVNGDDTYVNAAYSFEHGVNGAGAVPLTRNDWDVLFGNRPDRDTFGVTMVTDDCSRIQDMGALNWTDTFQVPVITAHPVPTIEPDINAIVGHMYVVHTKDTQTNLYFLFRVESLDPLKSVTITWKAVRSPEE
ncbi:MAG TPA: hypothetical protein VFM63_11530 [Pyrinomonadaceae bacterium]|nr:hypothetical protein [Pyrinomonadaceae bacterium]